MSNYGNFNEDKPFTCFKCHFHTNSLSGTPELVRREGSMATISMTSDWTVPLAALQADLELTDDAIGLLALQLQFDLQDLEAVAADSITGGGDDKKCDIVYVDKELRVAVVAQCYVSKKKRPAAPANKASSLTTAIAWLLTRELEALPDSIKGRADELRTAIAAGEITQLYVWFVHNLPESSNVATELKTVAIAAKQALKGLQGGSDINLFSQEMGASELARLYEQAERTIIVTDTFRTTVPGLLEVSGANWSAISTTVSGRWLTELYKKHASQLFSANLRGYLGSRATDSNINNGIKQTAIDEPSNFWVYNNGLTALVLNYQVGKRGPSGYRLRIDGLSIVNGAQTTGSLGSLGELPDPGLMIPIRFVKSHDDQIIANIVRYNNSQNKLQAADFRSTDPIQERLRREFEKVPKAEYEGGRRGGASDAIRRSKFTLPSYTVGQALLAFHGDPVTAYDKKSEIWTSEANYRRIFTDKTSARHIVFCYSLLERVNAMRLSLSQRNKREDQLTQAERENLKFLNKKGAAFLVVYVISNAMESILGRPITNKFDLQFQSNVSPEAASGYWVPIVDLVLSISAQAESAFSRNRISNEALKKAVPGFVGLIGSLNKIHQQTFSTFAKRVEIAK